MDENIESVEAEDANEDNPNVMPDQHASEVNDQTTYRKDYSSLNEESKLDSNEKMNEDSEKPVKKVLEADHPLMIKYQKDLKERLLDLLQETNEQLVELKRTISAQEKEHSHFATRGYVLQKDLKQQDDKLQKINTKCKEELQVKQNLESKCVDIKKIVHRVESNLHDEVNKDTEYQEQMEDIAFEVVQLTSLQFETYTDAKSLKRAVEKTTKDRENLELQKLRQDLLITRLENDKFNLEDKIHLYKTQWAIKKEEVNDLRKELNAANMEMQTINYEKQQIVHQWRQSLASLEKQDQILSNIRESVRSFEDGMITLNMDISSQKKSVRKELERNETLTAQLQFREADIARVTKDLNETADREDRLHENLSVVEKIIEITENGLNYLNDKRNFKEKELEEKEKLIQKACEFQKNLEKKQMEVFHEKLILTKASKNTEKRIKAVRKAILLLEEKGSNKENEKEKLLLKVNNLHSHLNSMEEALNEIHNENRERALLLNRSEAIALKTREKLEQKFIEYKILEDELSELIALAGGQELAPFERELANLRKEINVTEQGKREMETEYLRFQRELFSLTKQSTVKQEENDLYKKKAIIMEEKKVQLEADITKEEKNMKEIEGKMRTIENELAHINKLLHERKELQEALQQSSELSKDDFIKMLQENELKYLQKQSELNYIRKKKRKHFRKLIEVQEQIVCWESKVHLVDETRKVLKSKPNLDEIFNLRSEIRRLHVKLEHIKKEEDILVQEMGRAVYRHTSLYVEADKQALFGKRRKSPEYVTKRIKTNLKKIHSDKKLLEHFKKEIGSLKQGESQLNQEIENENQVGLDFMDKISSFENNTDKKQQQKRQDVLKLSLKQKKGKLFQKVLDGTYVRAVRNEARRPEETEKVQSALRAIQVISQAAINEHPDLTKELSKIMDYIIVSKYI